MKNSNIYTHMYSILVCPYLVLILTLGNRDLESCQTFFCFAYSGDKKKTGNEVLQPGEDEVNRSRKEKVSGVESDNCRSKERWPRNGSLALATSNESIYVRPVWFLCLKNPFYRKASQLFYVQEHLYQENLFLCEKGSLSHDYVSIHRKKILCYYVPFFPCEKGSSSLKCLSIGKNVPSREKFFLT